MADQNITELPIKTNSGVASTDYMLGIDSAEGYQILVRDVAKYIVENYNGSSIIGSAQTVKSAFDALNSKKYELGTTLGNFLNNNDDLNQFYTPGTFACKANATASSISNCPTTLAFKLIVEFSTGNGNPCQTIIEYSTGTRYYRYTTKADGTGWSEWIKQPTRAEITELNSNLTGKSLPIKMRIVCNNASTDTVHTLGYVTANYGSFLIALRTDTAADGTWFGLVRHNSAGWQISEIYKDSTVYTPYVDTDGSIKTSSANNSMVHGMLIALATWN